MKIAPALFRRVLLLPLLVSTVFAGTVAAEELYNPARFAFKGGDLIKRIEIPKQGLNVTLYCRADISASGQISRTKCYDADGDNDIELQTQTALTQLAFTPALVNGEAVPVRVSFRVAYTSNDSQSNATLIPNLGTMQSRYGRDYIAPQERLDVTDWYRHYNQNSWLNGEDFLAEGPLARVAATVSENGKPTMVRTIEADRAFRRDADAVKFAVKQSRFIPGFVGDKPVPMGYLAVVNYPESNQAVGNR